MTATWTKLREGLGVRAPAGTRAGQRLTVQSRDGRTTVVVVGKVIWEGRDKHGERIVLAAVTLRQRALAVGIPYSVVYGRVRRGWPVARALSEPKRPRGRKPGEHKGLPRSVSTLAPIASVAGL